MERAPRAAMLDVVSELCGVHAQLMSSAELTLWARVDALEPDAVARALWEERALVKTWAMRGTLHLLPTSELGLWHAALGTYRHYLKPFWARGFGITAQELDALLAAVPEALAHKPLTREELAAAVGRISGSENLADKVSHSWGSLLKPATYRGQLCFGPSDGQRVRFTRPDRWVGAIAAVDPDMAHRSIARRYLGLHGPATREDYARWWALSPAAAGRLLASLDADAVEVDVGGVAMWMLAADVDEAAASEPARAVRLLPAFDQYVVAATLHAARLMPGDFKAAVYRPQGWLSPVICVDGRLAGVWRHERKGKRIVVSVEPFKRLPAWVREGVTDEAERLAAFLGGELAPLKRV